MNAVLLRICMRGALGLLVFCFSQGIVSAQDNGLVAEAPAPKAINPAVAEKLVKYAIIAIDQGNATGNYSVLRELFTPKFQATVSSAQLSDAFAKLRKMKLDMSALVMLKPTFTKQPAVENGQVKIVGYFATTPIRINFSMTYAQQNGQPRIAGLAINPTKATAAADGGTADPSTTAKSNAQ